MRPFATLLFAALMSAPAAILAVQTAEDVSTSSNASVQNTTAVRPWGQRKYVMHRKKSASRPRQWWRSKASAVTWSTSWATTVTYGDLSQQTAMPAETSSAQGQAAAVSKGQSSKTTSTTPSVSARQSSSSQARTTQASTAPSATSIAPAATATSTAAEGSVEKVSLDLHNEYRARHGVGALTWSTELADAAQAWADKCVFAHGGGQALSAGENLAAWSGSSSDVTQGIQMWYNEVADYDFASPGYSSATGHFTQMVWAGTTKLGCAVTECSPLTGTGSNWSGYFYVCEYLAAGNIVGGDYFADNVFPAQS